MPLQILKKLLLQSFVCTFAMLMIYYGLNEIFTGSVWEGMTISKSALKVEYCEFNNTHKLFHQSINTYSNVVYFFFGIFICLIAKEDSNSQGLNSKNRLAE